MPFFAEVTIIRVRSIFTFKRGLDKKFFVYLKLVGVKLSEIT